MWFLIAGWWLALGHIGTAIAQAITIIGIPLAWANIKLIPVTCFPPFGKEVIATSDAAHACSRLLDEAGRRVNPPC